ncbi:MAG: HlyD family efflux transporter periplasmic adaptor subunit [Gemmatimonadetes bacterium]|nr:HlyD family efflux transporter periplasmic adaptor subunit [Gemmatimonadota bacterium]HPF61036.1 HlyD family efflux transporter periplasmic adaptor subunit [Gemmatimonadales bacterium]HRX17884.1 HlyD family efflux transporter periplasmic adaptor subunit [Gemmatimonadales bacterium]
MPLPAKRWLFAAAAVVVIGVPTALLLAGEKSTDGAAIETTVQRGDFAVTVTTSGELQALSAVEITAPEKAQQAGAFQMKIAELVPEGTIVAAGDKVAELDRSSLATRMQEVGLAVQKASAVYEQAQLDSALTLSKAREDIRTMELGLEEKKLAKEQAVFEAPTVRRQAEIDLEKAERALAQARLDYDTRTEQSKAKMREVGADLSREQNRMQAVQDVMGEFTIMAPAPGMVIYRKEWNGKKRQVGSQVSAWDPVVATLPDLNHMESITYVNEIDIKKLSVDQPVTLTLDSDPDKVLTGIVTKVANVGEERPNTDAKVFEVRIAIEQSDTTLRPGMTTANVIRTLEVPDVLFVPIEAVDNADGVPFVYLRRGRSIVRQEVVTGAMNDDSVVITQGVAEGDVVLLTAPADAASLDLVRLPDSPVGRPTAGGDTATGTVPVPAKDSTAPDQD